MIIAQITLGYTPLRVNTENTHLHRYSTTYVEFDYGNHWLFFKLMTNINTLLWKDWKFNRSLSENKPVVVRQIKAQTWKKVINTMGHC